MHHSTAARAGANLDGPKHTHRHTKAIFPFFCGGGGASGVFWDSFRVWLVHLSNRRLAYRSRRLAYRSPTASNGPEGPKIHPKRTQVGIFVCLACVWGVLGVNFGSPPTSKRTKVNCTFFGRSALRARVRWWF